MGVDKVSLMDKGIFLVQIWDLDLKYWGEKALSKIVSKIGKFIKVDQATAKREKLQFARVLIEVSISQDFPNEVSFLNEKGVSTQVRLKYDWKPVICSKCKILGHGVDACRKRTQKKRVIQNKAWIPKVTKQIEPLQNDGSEKEDEEHGFQITKKPKK
ncbi:uncharacterized protein LOC110697694 [Chenopodium quinoa]|uniref:uncharacterized protein LOC110697694 n=1 Tax=Chenopodium quinoa TaxID=63459 RepID=UPI000B78B900|nr:uncharacterized protein LOC110697694 [Chenopodium quinoa]